MTSDLDEALAGTEPAVELARTVVRKDRGCYRHDWVKVDDLVTCERCGRPKDESKSRSGRSASRFGKVQERRIQAVYGPRKVGQFGDAIDLLGRDFKWQSKATRAAPPLWLVTIHAALVRVPTQLVLDCARAMASLAPHLKPLVITPYVANGIGTRDWIWVRAVDWYELHGDPTQTMPDPSWWMVMSGAHFLECHGQDRPGAYSASGAPEGTATP